ncbi:MAG TPA: MalY/PatB family protein [Aggregatilinea sp.]|uniref:MalY/PatB family protein n=1 Tax=Aggregatilinea sp. TaxID=2806333 RepID=UPI002C109586|nr:MalY/PatB family protein [Aggregatilinea sp.]HML22291.1 MalY/PatB family protein [Aggregatilinea sp.]
MTVYDFDKTVHLRRPDVAKWSEYPEDVLPMWVADMDFPAADPIRQALHERIDQGILGYPPLTPPDLADVICERMKRLYGWDVQPDDVLFLPGLVFGLNVVTRLIGRPGDGVLVQPPIYPPFLAAPPSSGKFLQPVDLVCTNSNGTLHYDIDYDALEAAITPQTSLMLFCNPHNPAGRVFTADEVRNVAEICLKHHVTLCADEIHSDLIYDGRQHIPAASISPEISQNTITLLAPSKTYNIAGLFCSVAIVQNADLRARIAAAIRDTHASTSVLSLTAAVAAYRYGGEWLAQVRAYLQQNRDTLVAFVREQMPQIKMTAPEGTYLAWMDCGALDLQQPAYRFFLDHARVALGNGQHFGGRRGNDFVRLNFACSKPTLGEGLRRLAASVADRA